MESSQTIAAIAKALSAAQSELKDVPRTASNPYFKSKYAPLECILESIRPVLSKHGLAITQLAFCDNGKANIETVLLHESGEWISSKLSLTPTKADPQGMGSAITYARRYAVSAIVGIASEDDDDGNTASKPHGSTTAPQSTPAQPKPQPANTPKPEPVKQGVLTVQGVLTNVERKKAKTGKEYGVIVLDGGNFEDVKMSTWETSAVEEAEAAKGMEVVAEYEMDKTGKYKNFIRLVTKDDLPF